MKRTVLLSTLAIALCASSNLMAQTPNPGGSNPNNNPNFPNEGTANNTRPNNGVNPNNRVEVPFDAGLSVLLGAGAIAAVKRARARRH